MTWCSESSWEADDFVKCFLSFERLLLKMCLFFPQVNYHSQNVKGKMKCRMGKYRNREAINS